MWRRDVPSVLCWYLNILRWRSGHTRTRTLAHEFILLFAKYRKTIAQNFLFKLRRSVFGNTLHERSCKQIATLIVIIYFLNCATSLEMADEDPTAEVSAFALAIARAKKEVSIHGIRCIPFLTNVTNSRYRA